MHGAAHGRVEQGADPPAGHRADRVVQVLTDLQAERDPARLDAVHAHAQQGGDRRARDAALRDSGQVLQAAEITGERRPDQRVLPGDLAAAHRVFAGRADRLMAEFLHGTQLRDSAFYYATIYAETVRRTSFEGMTCSVAQCLEVVGEWWSLLIVRDAFLGVTRFDDFQARLGISRNILNQRLNHLVEHGVLERIPYEEHPPRSEYRLTEKGRDLFHVMTAMRQWGDRWTAPDGPPLKLRHKACGHVTKAVVVCSHCGEPLDARSVTAQRGPGAT